MPDQRVDAPEADAKSSRFSYDMAIQPNHNYVIESISRAVQKSARTDEVSLIDSVFSELRKVAYVGRTGLEFDFSAINKTEAANCFGLACLATSCLVRLLGDRMRSLVVLGKRKRDLVIGVHAWSVTLFNAQLIVFDPEFHSSRLINHSDYWKETAPMLAFDGSGVWVGAQSVYEQFRYSEPREINDGN